MLGVFLQKLMDGMERCVNESVDKLLKDFLEEILKEFLKIIFENFLIPGGILSRLSD